MNNTPLECCKCHNNANLGRVHKGGTQKAAVYCETHYLEKIGQQTLRKQRRKAE